MQPADALNQSVPCPRRRCQNSTGGRGWRGYGSPLAPGRWTCRFHCNRGGGWRGPDLPPAPGRWDLHPAALMALSARSRLARSRPRGAHALPCMSSSSPCSSPLDSTSAGMFAHNSSSLPATFNNAAIKATLNATTCTMTNDTIQQQQTCVSCRLPLRMAVGGCARKRHDVWVCTRSTGCRARAGLMCLCCVLAPACQPP